MKNTKQELPVKLQNTSTFSASIGNRLAFTLIELLVVIAIMAILAAFIFPVVGQIKKREYISMASAELTQIGLALEDYKNQYGVYPPSNPLNSSLTNTLYYELAGVMVTNISGNYNYATLDSASAIPITAYSAPGLFGIGAINCLKTNDTESAKAKSFLSDLKSARIGKITVGGDSVNLLITSARGPDSGYKPLGPQFPDENPFRYVYPGTNNPNSYDLWVQLVYNGKSYLVCNWNKQAIINSPLP